MADYQPRDLNALEKAVNDAAGKVSVLWTSFTVLGLYVVITTASVTHRDLLLNTPIRMPVLAVDLPVNGYFVVAPLIYFVFHLYLSLQLLLLTRKVDTFQMVLRRTAQLEADRVIARQRLDAFPFVQLMAREDRTDRSPLRMLLVLICAITGTLAPLLVLIQLQLAYLPAHQAWITWLQRGCIAIDLLLVWAVWINIGPDTAPTRRRILRAVAALPTLAVLIFSVGLATFPGEIVYDNVVARALDAGMAAMTADKVKLSRLLFEGDFDAASARSTSLFANRLMLAEARLSDPAKPLSLRGRDLSNAIFRRADLRGADFSGANLTGASFIEAKLQSAWFGCIWMEHLNDDEPPPHDAVCARLPSANFQNASLQGAAFQHTLMQGARFQAADLRGVTFAKADLSSADFSLARAIGTQFRASDLTAANFGYAKLWGADLAATVLRGASFSNVEAQGADFSLATLDGAVFQSARLNKATLPDDNGGALFVDVDATSQMTLSPGETPVTSDLFRALEPAQKSDLAKIKAAAIIGVENPPVAAHIQQRLDALAPSFPPQKPYRGFIVDSSHLPTTPAFERAKILDRQAAIVREVLCSPRSNRHVVRGLINNQMVLRLVDKNGILKGPPLTNRSCPGLEGWTALDFRRLSGMRRDLADRAALGLK
ncbi:pentapeptide repeat-containing protein [Caulobacter soli]|uniref:pentapeptide repeat-containing protein n=1 Tax=Caulobacter soli TaxID=2708539 RepID=UPI0013EAA68B|nr:pentapeptide repeat-containing protein [Caulobacter soli]